MEDVPNLISVGIVIFLFNLLEQCVLMTWRRRFTGSATGRSLILSYFCVLLPWTSEILLTSNIAVIFRGTIQSSRWEGKLIIASDGRRPTACDQLQICGSGWDSYRHHKISSRRVLCMHLIFWREARRSALSTWEDKGNVWSSVKIRVSCNKFFVSEDFLETSLVATSVG